MLGASGAEGILLPDSLSATPSEVTVLNTEALQAHSALTLAGQQARAPAAEVKRADAIDAAADRAAVASGAPLPEHEQRAAPAAAEAATLAKRRQEAAHQNSRDAMTLLARAIHRHRTTWLTEQEGVVGALRDDLRTTYAALTQQLDQLDRERQVLNGLRDFPDGGVLTLVDFGRSDRYDEQAAHNYGRRKCNGGRARSRESSATACSSLEMKGRGRSCSRAPRTVAAGH